MLLLYSDAAAAVVVDVAAVVVVVAVGATQRVVEGNYPATWANLAVIEAYSANTSCYLNSLAGTPVPGLDAPAQTLVGACG